jgi:chemotaxis protein MotB
MNKANLILLFIIAVFTFSCVPLKQLTSTKGKISGLEAENEQLKEANRNLTVENNELEGKFNTAYLKFIDMDKEKGKMVQELESLRYQSERDKKSKEDLEKQIALLKDGSSEEITKLMEELQELQLSLQEREDRVRKSEDQLKLQEEKLRQAEETLNQQQAKMLELQDALNKQKDAVAALKEKVSAALRGFYDQGLTVHEKNGKVYVSLEEQLLFQSGSYNVDPKGQQALKSLSELLSNNPDIHIMVEGHTDNVPLNGAGQVKDNWDLSVMRATAVTKIILSNKKIDPKRITSSGRGEFFPLDPANTAAARTKNRRTEIILTPNLSEVLQLLQSN